MNIVEQKNQAIINARALMKQQNKTALELLDHISADVFSSGKWINNPSELFEPLKTIATIDKEFCANKNKTEALNKVRKAINEAQLVIVDHIEKNGFKLKSDGTLFKKDKEAISDLINKQKEKHGVYIHHYVSAGSFVISVKSHYQSSLPGKTGYAQSQQIEETAYYFDIDQNKATISNFAVIGLDEYEVAKKRFADIEKEIYKLEREKSALKFKFDL